MKNKLRIAANFHSKINTHLPTPPSLAEETPKTALYSISEGIYFSNYQSACDTMLLQQYGITHVINCTAGFCANKNVSGISYFNVQLQDISDYDLIGCLNVIIPLIEELRLQKGSILVHCNEGRSRAPAVMAGYMVTKLSRPLNESLELLRRLNDRVDINIGFLMQLENLSKMAK
jgi:hypothetical protein